jgi:NADH-quinone oxidoreductase subunit A
MAESRLTVVLLLATAVGMAGGLLVLTHLLPKLVNRRKVKRIDDTPYECGMKPYQRVERHRFSIHFYLVAMLFILFDIEAAFLFPWAVTFRDFAADKMFVLGEMGVFLGILVLGFIYVWKRGALEWE